MADVYNVFNTSPVLTRNAAIGPTFYTPTAVLQSAFLKVGGRVHVLEQCNRRCGKGESKTMSRRMTAGMCAATGLVILWIGNSSGQWSICRRENPKDGRRKTEFNGIWESLSTANWDLQDHSAVCRADVGNWGDRRRSRRAGRCRRRVDPLPACSGREAQAELCESQVI